MKKFKKILPVLYVAVLVFVIVLEANLITFSSDEKANGLIKGFLSRLSIALVLFLYLITYERKILTGGFKRPFYNLLWAIPCFLVMLANFPFSAMIQGSAVIERADLILIFAAQCVSIGLLEEFFFRGIVHQTIKEKFLAKKVKHGYFWAVALSSALFGLWHLTNILFGAGIGASVLQAGYSFLIGAMLAVTFDKTENIWLCVFIHAAFDFGGNLIPTVGSGLFQDTTFWILTCVCGVICGIYIVVQVIRNDKKAN